MLDAAEIDRLRAEFADALSRVAAADDLRAVRDRYLARKGGVVADADEGGGRRRRLPIARRLGRLANELKTDIEAGLAAAPGRRRGRAARRRARWT